MKKKALLTLMLLPALMLFGCRGSGSGSGVNIDGINSDDLNEFYYTYENINYNACYQRYLFHVVEGKRMFFHEKRERPNDYGWTDENDVTRKGDFELTDEEWLKFLELIKDGEVRKRTEDVTDGGSGPWMYIYAGKDTVGKEYYFPSYEVRLEFEAFCETLAESGR